MSKINLKPLLDGNIYDQYQRSGLIFRTNDGQTDVSIRDMQDFISNNWAPTKDSDKGPNFFNLVQNAAPAYSAAIVGLGDSTKPCPPIVWYNHDYCQPQDANGNYLDVSKYGKVVIGFLLDPRRIRIGGAACFDADSNLRNSGVVPNNLQNSKTTTTSLFSLDKTYSDVCTDGVKGKWDNPVAASLNNNSLINPFLLPTGGDRFGFASDKCGSSNLSGFLADVCTTKGVWWDKLFNGQRFRSEDHANFINCLSTGVEIEAEAYPYCNSARRISTSELGNWCVLREDDSTPLPDDFVTKYMKPNFEQATKESGGWLVVDDAPPYAVMIKNIWMPEVPVDGTSSAGANLAKEIECIASKRPSSLSEADFSSIEIVG